MSNQYGTPLSVVMLRLVLFAYLMLLPQLLHDRWFIVDNTGIEITALVLWLVAGVGFLWAEFYEEIF